VCPYTSASPCVGIPGANRKGGVLLVVFEACLCGADEME
jgi:hypothetical protein